MSSSSFGLPQELFLDILFRLPIEDLVRCTAVCKPWNSSIKNPTFISTHLEKAISSNNSSTDNRRLLFRLCTTQPKPNPIDKSDVAYVEHYSLRFDNKNVAEYKQLHFPANKFRSVDGCFRIAGSYNGLVCLVDDMTCYADHFILWNPTIQKAVRTARPTVNYFSHGPFEAFHGFGFDSETNDYKLLRYVHLDHNRKFEVIVEAEVYSLNSNSWKVITDITPSYGICSPFRKIYGNSFVNGAIHLLAYDRKEGYGYMARHRNLILAYDVSREVFREMELPDYFSDEYVRLNDTEILKYGESSIAVMTDDSERREIYLWVMKEYGEASSWTKVWVEDWWGSVLKVLSFRNNEEVFVIMRDGWIGLCDLKRKHFEYVGDEGDGVQSILSRRGYPAVDSFVESLVLLDKATPLWNVIDASSSPDVDDDDDDDDSSDE
ncbi:hypothetical protein COLO4_19182 [Corchorus olitorius]|uniref:F-box domain-containing protein n=1 Tax=Corchorus olitorius TaxID=93759 RepID=A0A1R3J6F7_9ROSI|nr:hypothetical protein COLO4_19182 [Corchorus olitorius]